MDADDEHHPNNDVDDDEEAARRLQEQIWMAELQDDEMPPHHHHWGGGRPDQQQRGADEDDDDENDDDNDDAGEENEDNDADDDDPEDGHGVDAMRLRRQPPADNDDDDDNEDDDAAGADEEDDDDDDDDDPDANNANNNNNNLDDNDDDDPPPHNHHRRRRNAIDGGIAGDVIDDTTKGLITRSLKCPLVLYFEILSGGGGGDWEDEDDDDDNNNNNQNDNVDENNEAAAAAAAAAAGGEDNANNPINAIANDTNDEQRRQKRQLQQQLETLSPDNPILKKGTLIYIGLDKNSKLNLVFDQFCKFVNSKIPKGKSNKGKQSKQQHPIVNAVKPSDFEFVHATILDPEQTVEGSALMKNDRIGVYPDRSRQRAATAELIRQQRESDRKYFRDLRQLLLPHSSISSEGVSLSSTSPSSMCDVVLDCRGRVVDERGYSQNVLATTIRANSILPSKRCRWLGMKIELAREELRRRKEMTISSCEDNNDEDDDDEEEEEEEENNVADRVKNREGSDTAVPSEGGMKPEQQSDDEDGDIIMAEEPTARNGVADSGHNNMAVGGGAARGVAKVEDDEDDDDRDGLGANNKTETNKSLRAGNSSRHPVDPNSVWVILPDHSPQAVKLLLEYCYTNRVPSLGEEAFVRAGTTASALDSTTSADATGPVPPFPKQEWPDGGMPTVSLHLALAGIALAEEAHMPRLSLMCEIAASQLVDNHNVVDVLSACQIQQQKTGNRLPILRRAAMLDCIMANGSVGIDHLYAHPTFKNNLMERRGLVVPSLLDGSVEIMPTNMNTKEIQRKKEKMVWERKKLFENYDTTDKNKRIMERLKWRKQSVINRRLEIAFGPDFGPESVGLFKRLSKKIWRDTYQKDPPPLPASVRATVGRGTKRKVSSPGGGGTGGSTAADRTRNVRSRHARTNDNLA